jgi:uncharacterized protein
MVDENAKLDWVETRTGISFHPFDPKPEEVDIRDIAHSLSMLCRFNGHCSEFYSVAEHSIRVVDLLAAQDIHTPAGLLRGLLHDAGEAYVSDIPRPIKKNVSTFRVIEKNICSVIFERFYISSKEIYFDYLSQAPHLLFTNGEGVLTSIDIDDYIKQADNILLATEARDLDMNREDNWYLENNNPLPQVIVPLSQTEAKRLFLRKFYELASKVTGLMEELGGQ